MTRCWNIEVDKLGCVVWTPKKKAKTDAMAFCNVCHKKISVYAKFSGDGICEKCEEGI